MNIPDTSVPRIVVIGGGFGGINFIQKLPKNRFQIVLIDKHNYHTFQPLLYQVATAGLEPDSIAYPLRKLFKKRPDILFRMAEVINISVEENRIETNIGPLDFDYLVIATGSINNFFGMESFRKNAMAMKTVPDALNIRSLLLQNFEKALLTDNFDERRSLMSVVIVGAGPTGVELAGAIAELKNYVLPTDYPDLDLRRMQINLIEAAHQVLPPMSEQASRKAEKYLERLGVNVHLNVMVKDYDGDLITTNKKPLRSRFLIWAAGVQGSPVIGIPADSISRGNRIEVNSFNKINGCENIFAIGDVASMSNKEMPKGHPMLAQVAIQQGKLLAENIYRISQNKKPRDFKYRDYGSMATIGRNRAVADLPKWKTQGTFAWFVWMFVHLISLVGFRNRVVVLLNWAVNYFNYNRDIRLIIRPYKKSNDENIQRTEKKQ